MRRGRQRAEWDTAAAILASIASAAGKRRVSYEEMHPHRREIEWERRQRQKLRSRKARRREAELGWALMKEFFGGSNRAL